jgi:hypothetical protein
LLSAGDGVHVGVVAARAAIGEAPLGVAAMTGFRHVTTASSVCVE